MILSIESYRSVGGAETTPQKRLWMGGTIPWYPPTRIWSKWQPSRKQEKKFTFY